MNRKPLNVKEIFEPINKLDYKKSKPKKKDFLDSEYSYDLII